MNLMSRLLLAALLAFQASTPAWAQEQAKPVVVFAAASLKEAIDESVSAWERRTGQQAVVSYAASSALARQIEQGAPADVFLSADLDWMDYLQDKALIDTASRSNLLGNTLVLIAPTSSGAHPLELKRGTDLKPLLQNGRLALGMTASVPAGKYAKAAFTSLGLWDALAPRVVETENVRAALMLVARGEARLGVVYGTDAKADPRVKVLATFPSGTHPAIVYPVARLKSSDSAAAKDFVAWLDGADAAAIFRRHGFTLKD